jgi:hypothetical protein
MLAHKHTSTLLFILLLGGLPFPFENFPSIKFSNWDSHILTFSHSISAQEIEYNLTPEKQLGPELWKLPIGGDLTMSRDGRTLLVASTADSAFYVVDVETGTIRRRLTPKYFPPPNRSTVYRTDDDLKWISLGWTDWRGLWDIEADTIITAYGKSTIFTISRQHARLHEAYKDFSALLDAHTLRIITQFPWVVGVFAWFDDARGILYRVVPTGAGYANIEEYDALSGAFIRKTGIHHDRGTVVRPPNSQWLYYFTLGPTDIHPEGWVEAIHLETGERVRFMDFGPGNPDFTPGTYGHGFISFTDNIALAGASGPKPERVWTFDAESRTCRTIVEQPFVTFLGFLTTKEYAISLALNMYIHCWDGGDSSGMRCQTLVPATTQVHETPLATKQPAWLATIQSELTIDLHQPIRSIIIASTEGRVLLNQPGPFEQRPIRIPIPMLPSGSYLCSVRTAQEVLSASFTLTR